MVNVAPEAGRNLQELETQARTEVARLAVDPVAPEELESARNWALTRLARELMIPSSPLTCSGRRNSSEGTPGAFSGASLPSDKSRPRACGAWPTRTSAPRRRW